MTAAVGLSQDNRWHAVRNDGITVLKPMALTSWPRRASENLRGFAKKFSKTSPMQTSRRRTRPTTEVQSRRQRAAADSQTARRTSFSNTSHELRPLNCDTGWLHPCRKLDEEYAALALRRLSATPISADATYRRSTDISRIEDICRTST